jgi:hypothetical protein
VDESASTVVLDTTHGCWVAPTGGASGEDYTRRCRHAVASVGPFVFVYGGLKVCGLGRSPRGQAPRWPAHRRSSPQVQPLPAAKAGLSSRLGWKGLCMAEAGCGSAPPVRLPPPAQGSQLLDDLLVADDSNGTELSIFDPRSPAWQQFMETMHGNAAASRMLEKAAAEEAAAAAALNVRRVSAMDDLRCVDEQLDSAGAAAVAAAASRQSDSPSANRAASPEVSLGKDHVPGTTPYTPDVKLWHRAVVVHQENSLRGLVRQLSIDQLDNEGRRVSIYENGGPGGVKDKSPLFTRSMSVTVRPRRGLAGGAGWRACGVGWGGACRSRAAALRRAGLEVEAARRSARRIGRPRALLKAALRPCCPLAGLPCVPLVAAGRAQAHHQRAAAAAHVEGAGGPALPAERAGDRGAVQQRGAHLQGGAHRAGRAG